MAHSAPELPANRSGVTLIEVLVVISVIVILIGILIPAVQRVRASAARASCTNNLKQVGLAFHAYEGACREFPPGRISTPTLHGWAYLLLPYIEQHEVYKIYDPDSNWSSTNNRAARRAPIRTFVCPAVGNPERTSADPSATFPSAVSDYAPVSAVGDKLCVFLGYTPTTFPTERRKGVLETNQATRIEDIRDGTSSTLMIVEDADRPNRWRLGSRVSGSAVTGAGWADDQAPFTVEGTDSDTATADRGVCVVNCTNNNEVYSFHSSGANVLFADGSVHFLRASITPHVMVGLITKRNGDPVPDLNDL